MRHRGIAHTTATVHTMDNARPSDRTLSCAMNVKILLVAGGIQTNKTLILQFLFVVCITIKLESQCLSLTASLSANKSLKYA